MIRLKLILLTLILSSCAQVYYKNELTNQIISPRRGYDGFLTNRHCKEWDKLKNCKTYEVEKYDIRDQKVRETLIAMDFVCYINKRRFRVDKARQGFVRREYKETLFGNRKLVREEFLPIDNYEFLIQSNTKCFRNGAYMRE